MKTRLFPLLLFSAMPLLPACEGNEEPDSTQESNEQRPVSSTGFWMQPHTVFLGLEGRVSSLTETLRPDDEGSPEEDESISTWTNFNADGMITYYNPTGIAGRRWIGMEMNSYAYSYDGNGRLEQTRITTIGEEQTVYTLAYDDTDERHIPLPFPLGNMDFFMFRGISALSSSNPGFTCTLSDREVTYTQTETFARGTMETVTAYRYAENACFPSESSVVVRYDGEELSADHTDYEFADDGRLLSCVIRRTENGELTETEIRRYHPSLPLCLQSKEVTTGDGSLIRYNYTYDTHGRLNRITLTQDGTTATEAYEYVRVDNAGNWCEGRFCWSSHVNMAHWDGTVRLSRNLQYLPSPHQTSVQDRCIPQNGQGNFQKRTREF